MKKFIIILSLLLTSIVNAQIVNIPDANFKTVLLEIADTNNDGEIQVSEAEALQIMNVRNRDISSMEGIQSFSNLTYLNCATNDLTELDLTQNVNLIELWCGFNDLTELDLSQNVNLVEFFCITTLISNFDLSHNLDLVVLFLSGNALLTSLDLSANQALEELECHFSGLTSLITQNQNLRHLNCTNNQLSTIDISQNPNLEFFSIYNNNLTELDVTQNQNLEVLSFGRNSLTSIDISQNPNLISLSFGYNEISTLDLSLSPNLTWLDCNDNLLSELDFTNNPGILQVRANNNLITELDFSQSAVFESIVCNDNQLVSLNVQNGNNAALFYCISNNNPNLNCIQVDDPLMANNDPNWIKDPAAVYSVDCSLGINDSEINSIEIYPNPVQSHLNVQSQESIKSLQLYDISGKLVFTSEENINQIDFSNYTNGIYFLKIKTALGNVVEKILKE